MKKLKTEERKPRTKKSIEKTLAFQPGADWNWLFKEKKNGN